MSSADQIAKAVSSLQQGRLVALPTETVYGLCAPIDDFLLVEKIFSLKSRPHYDPLIVHVADRSQIAPLVKNWCALCDRLAENFWPGPLTLVLEKTELVSDLITAGLPTVGIRIPNSNVGLQFLKALNRPVAAPSANMFKKLSPTTAQDVRDVFHEDDVFVLDGGDCSVGIESTILSVAPNGALTILRPGLISKVDIEKALIGLTFKFERHQQQQINAPGQMDEHYRPHKPLITILAPTKDTALSKLDSDPRLALSHTWLELPEDARFAARQLYGLLRSSSQGSSELLVLYLPSKHLKNENWEGILDRLKRASTSYLEF